MISDKSKSLVHRIFLGLGQTVYPQMIFQFIFNRDSLPYSRDIRVWFLFVSNSFAFYLFETEFLQEFDFFGDWYPNIPFNNFLFILN